jgi:hypothetical protein
MKTRLLVLSISFLLAATLYAQAPIKKYDIKSGIITLQNDISMGTFQMKTESIIYFDDYGMKECKEIYNKDKLQTITFSDGKNIYIVHPDKKVATIQGPAYRGTEMRVDRSEFGTKKDWDEGKIKTAPAMTVAGKTCEVFVTDDGKGTGATYGGWNKILLYLDVKTKTVRTTLHAVKVEANAKVPAAKFAVPAGYKIQ